MSTLQARSDAAAAGARTTLPCVFYTLGQTEHCTSVPAGRTRWEAVADAVGQQLGREGFVEEPPAYDPGSRSWVLEVMLRRRWRRTRMRAVLVRWN